jgi:hypothetical protein
VAPVFGNHDSEAMIVNDSDQLKKHCGVSGKVQPIGERGNYVINDK